MPTDPAEYIPKFPQLSPADIKTYAAHFDQIDKNGNGKLSSNEIQQLFREAKIGASAGQIADYITQYDTDKDGQLDFAEFLQIFVQEKAGKKSALSEGLRQHAALIRVSGTRGETHYSQEEISGFVTYINQNLAGDPDLRHILPINPDDDSLFKAVHDGILACKLVNLAQPDTLDERVIATGKKLNAYSLKENCSMALTAARGIGVSTVNIGAEDLRDGSPSLVLGLTWQLVRLALTNKISLKDHPELFRLLKPGETIEQFLKLSPEEILLRWLNYHLERAGSARRASNFSGDIKDSEIYTTVLHQIAPECSLSPMREQDPLARAGQMLNEAAKIDCKKFVGPNEVVRGNHRLNLAFVANMFNTRPGLEALTEAEKAALDEALFKAGGSRDERKYCLWINSYGFDPLVMDLVEGLRVGEADLLLKLEEKVEPGCVDWKRVGKGKPSKFKAVQTLDLGLEIAKALKLVIVGISGADIYDGNLKLVLAVLWQLMRYDYVKALKKLGGGGIIKDEEIIAWANSKTGGKGVVITGFKDQAISDSKPLLTLIDSVKPGYVDWSYYEESDDPDKKKRNAMYAMSVIKRLGGALFALPEDVVEVNPQWVMTVYASLMGLQ